MTTIHRFNVHVHAATLLQLVGVDVSYPLQNHRDPQSLRARAGFFGLDAPFDKFPLGLPCPLEPILWGDSQRLRLP
jgi:hypothetical protein